MSSFAFKINILNMHGQKFSQTNKLRADQFPTLVLPCFVLTISRFVVIQSLVIILGVDILRLRDPVQVAL